MNATLLREDEGTPVAYPAVAPYQPEREGRGSHPDSRTVDAAVTWRAVERWTAHRWTPRSVEWIVRGPGEFPPPLRPFQLEAIERWHAGEWQTVAATPGPLGYELGDDVFKIAGTVGADAGPVPEAVAEAWRRLDEYNAGLASAYLNELAQTDGFVPYAAAKALIACGAADLLRPWRRL